MNIKADTVFFVCYFLLINTAYFWEQNLGLAAMIIYIMMLVFYGFVWLLTLFHGVKFLIERQKRSERFACTIIGVCVGMLVCLEPYGLIDFSKYEPVTVLEARAKGGGNCSTEFKLFSNNTFTERKRCFGTSTTKGDWVYENDTIYFINVREGFLEDKFYTKAIVRLRKDETIESLFRFEDAVDTIGTPIWVFKNELNQDIKK